MIFICYITDFPMEYSFPVSGSFPYNMFHLLVTLLGCLQVVSLKLASFDNTEHVEEYWPDISKDVVVELV